MSWFDSVHHIYLDIHSKFFSSSNVQEDTKPALFLNFIGKDAYAVIRNLSFLDSPISMPYEKIRNALLQYVRPMNFEAAERAKFNKLILFKNQSVRDFVLVLEHKLWSAITVTNFKCS